MAPKFLTVGILALVLVAMTPAASFAKSIDGEGASRQLFASAAANDVGNHDGHSFSVEEADDGAFILKINQVEDNGAGRRLMGKSSSNANFINQALKFTYIGNGQVAISLANAQAINGNAIAISNATAIDHGRRRLMGKNTSKTNYINQALKFKYIGNGQVAISLANAQAINGSAIAISSATAIDNGRKLLQTTNNVNYNNQSFDIKKIDSSTAVLIFNAQAAQAIGGNANANSATTIQVQKEKKKTAARG